MDRRVIRVLTAGALTMFAITACCAQQVLYVDAQRGSDLHDGTQAKPFASLARARDAVRALKKANAFPERGVVIEVSGNFSLATQNLVLEAQDGGTGPDAPVVVRAGASGAVITGGMRCRRRVSAR